MNAKQIAALAKQLGLIKARGTCNGKAYWNRPGSDAIITADRVLELAGY